MKNNIVFNFYYGNEAEQFKFYRIPKVLFTDDHFKNLSSDAKILYGLMLDRMGLSVKNKWMDKDNKVFIIFTLEQVMENLNCGKDKGVKIFAELDSHKGIGLIERVKQGFGKPALIYVKNFIIMDEQQDAEKTKSLELDIANKKIQEKNNQELIEYGKQDEINKKQDTNGTKEGEATKIQYKSKLKSEVIISENQKCHVLNNRNNEVDISAPNDTDINDTDINNTDETNHINHNLGDKAKKMDVHDKVNTYRYIIKKNIDYEILIQEFATEEIDNLVELILEIVCTERKTIWIAGAEHPYQLVKSRMLKLNATHIQYVIQCMEKNTKKVHNIKAYIMAALFNAGITINQYYRAEVNHDFFGNEYHTDTN